MQIISDPKQVSHWKQKAKIDDTFHTEGMDFYLYHYEPGELLCSPNDVLKDIHFIVDGKIKIYSIHEDGSLSTVSLETPPVILGDIEYVLENFSTLFVEAHTDVTSLVLPASRYRSKLDQDPGFLRMILSSIAFKFSLFSSMHNQSISIEERLLMYMETFCKGGILSGVEEATVQLHCSRRQLQRVLKKLCEDNQIEKLGKGTYRLR